MTNYVELSKSFASQHGRRASITDLVAMRKEDEARELEENQVGGGEKGTSRRGDESAGR